MRIHVLSDLHLEFGRFDPPEIDADVIVLAGDIDLGVRGVHWARSRFEKTPVIYVPGNHEYYGHAIPRLDEKLLEEAESSNVHVLNDKAITISGVHFLGCTLWTDLALVGDSFVGAAAVASVMNDYRKIRVSPKFRRLRPQDTRACHLISARWLKQEGESAASPVVVVTHHSPSVLSLSPGYRDDPVSSAFASNMESLIRSMRPDIWIHGHIHAASDYQLGNTRIVCNPRGYQGDSVAGFNPQLVLEVGTGSD